MPGRVSIIYSVILTLIVGTSNAADSTSGKEYKPWPAVVAEYQGKPMVIKNCRIVIAPAKDQTGAGTGGSVEDIIVSNLTGGKSLQIEAQCVGLRVLESYNSFPQIEIWHHYGDGAYSRTLFRVEHRRYKAIREDSFDRNINDATRRDITASLPGGDEYPLYYTGTGPGDWYQPDEGQ